MSIDRLSIAPGDTVDVPWGFDTFPATVLEVYESGGQQRVRVRLLRSDTDSPEEAVLRVSDLVASPPTSKYTRPGSWQHVQEYEAEFTRTVRNLLDASTIESVVVTNSTVDHYSDLADLVARVGDKIIAFELKWQLHEIKNAVSQASRFANNLTEHGSGPASVVIVSPNSPRSFLGYPSEGPLNLAPAVYFVRWSGQDDNERLGEALGDALRSSTAPS